MAQGTEGNSPGDGGSSVAGSQDRDDAFLAHRGMVFTIAYDITGMAADAEDVVQETYLRWRKVREPVANPRAYLARAATRQALNLLRTAARRREDYPGEWLPEPLPTGASARAYGEAGPEAAVLAAGEVSTALLVVLQTLSGPERAAFILHEVFDFGYPEIAAALDARQPAVRQLVHRARQRVRGAARGRQVPDAVEHGAVVERFMAAASTGRIQELLDLLAPDAVLISDGGGKARAALRPVHGPEKVARLLLGLAGQHGPGATASFPELNGLPAVAFSEAGTVTTAFSLHVVQGRVQAVFIMRNPDKLVRLRETDQRGLRHWRTATLED